MANDAATESLEEGATWGDVEDVLFFTPLIEIAASWSCSHTPQLRAVKIIDTKDLIPKPLPDLCIQTISLNFISAMSHAGFMVLAEENRELRRTTTRLQVEVVRLREAEVTRAHGGVDYETERDVAMTLNGILRRRVVTIEQ
ncbi:hypothetical protein LTR95_008178 [Oleoguttula sp. CCFEE 5521]